jgi:hypothetical protein
MTLHGLVTPKRRVINVANGSDVSPWVDISRCASGCYKVPAAYTNVGGTNFQGFDVSNDYGDPSGVPVTGALPVLANTAFTQQQTLSGFYALPAAVFSFRWFRFNGVANEGAARDLQVTLAEAYLAWKRLVVTIAAAGQNSGGVTTGGLIAGSFTVPTMTSTAITFGVSDDGGNWTNLKTAADANVSQTIAAGAVGVYPLPPDIANFRYFRLQAGSAEAALRNIILDLKYVA